MEELNPEILMVCSNCQSPMAEDAIFCTNCGYPEKGTDKEKAVYHAKKAMEKNQNIDADKKIKSARNVLYVMAGVTLLFGIIYFFIQQDIAMLVTNGILSVIYLVLGSWTSKKPLMALLLGLLLYLTTIVISAVFEPSTLVKGILWKVIIIAYLGKGIHSASSIKKT